MTSDSERLYREVRKFTNGSAEKLLQLLVATAGRATFKRIVDCPTYPVSRKTEDLPAAVNAFEALVTRRTIHLPTLFARLYVTSRTLTDRKLTGQFFTAVDVANWALGRGKPDLGDDFCDAGAGTGVFADAIMRTGVSIGSYVAIENDPILALCTAHVLELIGAPAKYCVWYANFLTLNERDFRSRDLNLPNVIIANPPFVRSRYLAGIEQIRRDLRLKLGFVPSSLSGAGSYFLSRAAELAGSTRSVNHENSTRNRRLLFLLPKEYAGAAHAVKLRHDLQSMHGWIYHKYKIPFRQTGIDRHRSNALALLFVFQKKKATRPVSSVELNEIARVKDILCIRRGISTGRNDFFVLTQEVVDRKRISRKYLEKVLPTRIHLPSGAFKEDDWERLREEGYPCWLLVLPDIEIAEFERPLQEYLREGLRRGLHATPTAKTLRTWFSLPVKDVPDVFITYFFRGAPRFILNDAKVFHLTNILGGRFVSTIHNQETRKAITCSLNEQAKDWMRSQATGREYKGGLRKIEPRELSQLTVDSALIDLLGTQKRAATATTGSLFD